MITNDKTTKGLVIVIVLLICVRILVPIMGFLAFPLPYYFFSFSSSLVPVLILAASVFLLIRRPGKPQRNAAIFGLVVSILSIFAWGMVYFTTSSRTACLQNMAPNAALQGCDLTGYDFGDVDLRGADLSNADLSDSSFVGGNFKGANLHGAWIFHTDLTNADLSGVDLSSASITGTSLVGSQLVNADLSGSRFGHCDFTHANLDYAILRGAELSAVVISDTSANGAIFDGAILISESELSEEFISGISSWNPPNIQSLRFAACNGSLIMASPYEEDSEYHPTLILKLPVESDVIITQTNNDWGPTDLRDLELVVCSTDEYIQIKTCEYVPQYKPMESPVKFVDLYQHKVTVVILIASSGEVLAEKIYHGPEPNCPSSKSISDEKYSEMKGDPVTLPDSVFTWINDYVYP